MAVEDIIWGKNRHVFGGIEPSNMVEFTVVPSISSIKIIFTPPGDTIIDGQTICTVAGVTIRRRSDRYPTNEFDGDEVCTIRKRRRCSYEDISVDPSRTYYYAAFPFSTQDVYNRNPANRATANG